MKKKNSIDLFLSIRNFWQIKPITKIKQDERKNNKRRRQNDKNFIKNYKGE